MTGPARHLALMMATASALNERASAWNARLLETSDGGVVAAFDAYPGALCVVMHGRSVWGYRLDTVDAQGATLALGKFHTLGFGRDFNKTAARLAEAVAGLYRALLSRPGVSRARHDQVRFIRAALWELDGCPPLAGTTPGEYDPFSLGPRSAE